MRATGSIEERPEHHGLVLTTTILAGYLTTLNTTVLGLAIPNVADDLQVDGASLDWVITGFILGLTATMTMASWLRNRLGERHAVTLAFLVFTAASVLCAVASDLPTLISARVLQGLGGGPLLPLSLSIVFRSYPEGRRGHAISVWGFAVATAPAIGPPLGGWLLAAAGWRAIFLALTVIAVVGGTLAWSILEPEGRDDQPYFDARGWVLAVLALAGVITLSRSTTAGGYADLSVGVLAAGSLVAGGAALRHLDRAAKPLLRSDLLRRPAFARTMLLVGAITAAQFAKLTFLPIELQMIRGEPPDVVGWLLAPSGVAVALTMPFGGRWSDRHGTRPPILVGALLILAGTLGLAALRPTTPIALVLLAIVVQSVGTGLSYPALQVAGMGAVRPDEVTDASTLLNVNRQVSGALASAILAGLVVGSLGTLVPDASVDLDTAQASFNKVHLLASLSVLVAIPAAIWPGTPGQPVK